jgi:hypothetical protein
MNIKKTMNCYLLSIVIMTGWVHAARIVFTGAGGDDCWTNEANWVYYKSNPIKRGTPTTADEVRLNPNTTVRITTPVTVNYLKTGVNGYGTVIIDGGSLSTVGTEDYNSASYNSLGVIIVTNGGAALFNFYFMVGFENHAGGRVEIYDGTVRVPGIYYHSKDYTGSEPVDTRTTISKGGVLDVNELTLNTGIMDVAGGTLIVRMGRAEEINQWIADGRIIAMGGAEGWKINVTVDPKTSYTVIVAESSSDPKPSPVPPVSSSVLFRPVPPVPSRCAG